MGKIISEQSSYIITNNTRKEFLSGGIEGAYTRTRNIDRAIKFYPREEAKRFVKSILRGNPNSDLITILPITITYCITENLYPRDSEEL